MTCRGGFSGRVELYFYKILDPCKGTRSRRRTNGYYIGSLCIQTLTDGTNFWNIRCRTVGPGKCVNVRLGLYEKDRTKSDTRVGGIICRYNK